MILNIVLEGDNTEISAESEIEDQPENVKQQIEIENVPSSTHYIEYQNDNTNKCKKISFFH